MINYSYLLINTGNVPLEGPFSVNDDRTDDESCPDTDTLDPGDTITCASSYTITPADMDSGSVSNTASGQGYSNGNPINSSPDSETVTSAIDPGPIHDWSSRAPRRLPIMPRVMCCITPITSSTPAMLRWTDHSAYRMTKPVMRAVRMKAV